MTTSSDIVAELAAGATATYDPQHLIAVGATRILKIEVRNLTNAVATYAMGGNGPTRSLVPWEVYICERNVDVVQCLTGTIEVVFST